MKTNDESHGSLDDLIFENRNHDYGAYAIRKSYHDNVNKGAMLAVGVVAIITILSVLPKEVIPPLIKDPFTPITLDHDVQIIPDLPPTPPARPQQPKGTSALTPKPIAAEPVETTIPPNDETIIGDPNGVEAVPSDVGDGPSVIPTEIGPSFPAVEKIWDHTEVMPEYVGGLNAMAHFISRNVKYPSRARRIEAQGTVFVSFIIGKDGSVLDPKIVKGFNADCEAEAIRVMTKMARWNPGLQSGVPVNVRMVIPIKFALSE